MHCSSFSGIPRITLSFGDTKVRTLFDTGASRSLINKKTFDRLNVDKSKLSTNTSYQLYDVQNKKLEILGVIKLKVTFGDQEFFHEFIVSQGISEYCILGIDAITEHQFVLDGRERRVYRIRKKTPGQVDDDAPILTLPAGLYLAPYTAEVCYVQEGNVSKKLPSDMACFVERALELPPGIEVHPFVSSIVDSGNYLIIISNETNRFVSLPKFQVLGTLKFHNPRASYETVEQRFCSISSISEKTEINYSEIPEQKREEFKQLISDYTDVFAPNSYEIGKTDYIKHQIDTQGHGPIRKRAYRTPFKLQEEMKKHIQEMLKAGIIRPSCSPWAAPVLLVKKQDNTTRFVTDFRALNSITKHDSYPLPRIDWIFDQLGQRKIFTSLDMAQGFFQVPMNEDSVEKTAFVCEEGLFEYLRLPMGLKNSPSTLSRLVADIFKDYIGKFIFLYMDDILIASNSVEEHIKHIKIVFDLLRKANLRLKMKKCKFLQKSVTFLGHVISEEGTLPNPATVDKILNFQRPQNLKELQGFIGISSYYRRYIKDFSTIAHPLTDLTKKNKKFIWEQEQQEAFDTLKSFLTSPPILAFPDFEKEFILQTDASGWGLGVVLTQLIDGKERVICYASRHLNQAEMKYPSIEKEALAIVFGIRYFRHYLADNPFTIETDCRPLLWLENIKQTDNGRLGRWAILLSSMKYKLKYKPGKVNRNADFLSRLPVAVIEEICDVRQEKLKSEQLADDECSNVIHYLETGELMDPNNPLPEWSRAIELFNIRNGILCRDYFPASEKRRNDCIIQAVLPPSLRKEIMYEYHDQKTAGHFAFHRTLLNIQKRYYWPNMSKEILEYCKSCMVCAKNKKNHVTVRPLLRPIDIANAPFDVITVDHLGPLKPASLQGNKYILVITDLFSKYVDCIALPDCSAKTSARAIIDRIFYEHGAPKCIISDRGSSFTSKIYRHIMKELNIKLHYSTSFHPQSDGASERWNRSLITMIRHYINDGHNDWEDLLKPLRFAYMNSVHSSTNETPYFLVSGRDPVMLIDRILDSVQTNRITPQDYRSQLMENLHKAYTLVRHNLVEERKHQKKQYDKRARDLKYEIGDKVLLDIRRVPPDKSKKFMPRFEGPYRILKVYENGTVDITGNGVEKRVNACRIKPLFETMLWRDDPCPQYSKIPFDSKPLRKEVSTSTSDLATEIQMRDKSNEIFPTENHLKSSNVRIPNSNLNPNPNNSRFNLRDRRQINRPLWQRDFVQ